MRRPADLLFFLMLFAFTASSQVVSADERTTAEIEENIRSVCESAPVINRESGFPAAKTLVSELLVDAEKLPEKHDLVPLIYITLSELSFGQGKIKQSYRQLIMAANTVRPSSDRDILIRILEQGIILNVMTGHPHDAIGLLDKWKLIGHNDKDLWKEKYLYYTALASYFVDDEDTLRECLDSFARMTDGNVPHPVVKNFWLLESMIACLEGNPDTAESFLDELGALASSGGMGGFFNFVLALQAQANGEPDAVVEEKLNASRMAYELTGRPGLYPLMLSMLMRYYLSDFPPEDWLGFHRSMARYATQDVEPVVAAFGYFSKALPGIDLTGNKEDLLRAGQKKLIFADNLIAQLQLKADRALETNYFSGKNNGESDSSFYTTILVLLLIVLLLVMVLRVRTQWLINRRLRESIEKSRMAERSAAHANKLMSDFVSNISHELKTPMGGLVGMTSILDELIADPVQRKYLGTIRECSKNLMILMDDLLDLGRIEAGRLEIDEVPFSLSATIEYCEQMVFHRAFEKGLEFKIVKDESMPDIFIGDATRIGQVLINLLNNAIKFTNRGSVCLSIEFKQASGQTGTLVASVKDTGIGISPEQLRTVFEPFNQTNSPPGKAEEGSGLGLAISKQLVDLMGGTLSVESEPNVGSTFKLELSLRRTDDESYPEDE